MTTVNVADFGALGGASDDTAAINAACTAALPGDTVKSDFPSHRISDTINIGNGTSTAFSTQNSISFVGAGAQPVAVAAGDNGGTRLAWYGSDDGRPMVRVNGPLTNIEMDNWMLDCCGWGHDQPAAVALHARHLHHGRIRRVGATRYTAVGLDVDTISPVPSLPPGVAIGGDDVIWERVDCAGPLGDAAVGLRLGPAVAGPAGGDNARNEFRNCWFWGSDHVDGLGALFRFTDNCSFFQCGFQARYGERTIYIQPPAGAPNFPAAVQFYSCFVTGRIEADSSWAPAHGFNFYPLSTTDGGVLPTAPHLHGVTTRGERFGSLLNGTAVASLLESPPAVGDAEAVLGSALVPSQHLNRAGNHFQVRACGKVFGASGSALLRCRLGSLIVFQSGYHPVSPGGWGAQFSFTVRGGGASGSVWVEHGTLTNLHAAWANIMAGESPGVIDFTADQPLAWSWDWLGSAPGASATLRSHSYDIDRPTRLL